MSVTVRPLAASDREPWQRYWLGYLEFYQSSVPDQITELTWERLLDPEFNLYCAVAELDGKVIGIVQYNFQNSSWSEFGYCLLEDLFTDPTVRGKGAGRAMIDYVIQVSRERKCSRVYWNTDATNAQASLLYDTYAKESGKRQYRLPQTY